MEFRSSHRFDRPFDAVAAALLDPDAHVARYELSGARDIQVLEVLAGDDRLDLKTARTVEGEVPAIAQKLVSATNTITTTDRWERGQAGEVRGTSLIEASSVPGTAVLASELQADGADACTLDVQLELTLTVPLIGDRFIKLLKPKVHEIIDAEFAAWDGYLAAQQNPA